MKVLKFGGTSMGDANALMQVNAILQKYSASGEQMVVVCSAMSGITNQLISIGKLAEQGRKQEAMSKFNAIKEKHFEAAEQLEVRAPFENCTNDLFLNLENVVRGITLIGELSSRSIAYLLSFGERLSTMLLVCYLQKEGLSAMQYDSTFIKTNGVNYEEDEINWAATKSSVINALGKNIQENVISVVTGFFGTNQHGHIALLGRGGSDFSGAILSVCLGINTLEIWTDVDGFLSADPRVVEDAQLLNEIGFQEASELCFFGAKVLHPKTIRPVIDNGGQVWIKNTFYPARKGTKIIEKARASNREVISISSKKVGLISLDLFASQGKKKRILSGLFQLAQEQGIDIDMIAASEAEISFCIEVKHLENKGFLDKLATICPYYIKENRSVVCIVSPRDVKGQFGVAGKIFNAIAESEVSVDMYSQNASEIAQLIVIRSEDTNKVVKNIHTKLVSRNAVLV